jgi:hypothetical protein
MAVVAVVPDVRRMGETDIYQIRANASRAAETNFAMSAGSLRPGSRSTPLATSTP